MILIGAYQVPCFSDIGCMQRLDYRVCICYHTTMPVWFVLLTLTFIMAPAASFPSTSPWSASYRASASASRQVAMVRTLELLNAYDAIKGAERVQRENGTLSVEN